MIIVVIVLWLIKFSLSPCARIWKA